MVRPRKYDEERINTSIRLSVGQKALIYMTFPTVQAFIEDSFEKLQKKQTVKPKKKKIRSGNGKRKTKKSS